MSSLHTCLSLALLACTSQAENIVIDITEEGRWRVISNETGPIGTDGTVRGAGGWFRLERAKRYGADAMRTWGLSALYDAVPEAEKEGLKISAGIWLTHEGKHYENCTDMDTDLYWMAEKDRVLDSVRKFKESNAILWWTVGNEIELEVDVVRGNECMWRRLEWLVKAVKAEDPNHPVGTVLAGGAQPKVVSIGKLCPSLDFLGVNTYGDDSLHLSDDLKAANWTKPFAIMEFGPTGHWASPLTSWDAYIEESSSEKVPRYNATCHSCTDDDLCIGAFAFVWGWKWEKTGTWYGMFNEWEDVTRGVEVECIGCESEVLGALEQCWTGKPRANPPPTIKAITVDGDDLSGMRFVAPRDSLVSLQVKAAHAHDHALTALWVVTEEIVSRAVGGAYEATNPLLSGMWNGTNKSRESGLSVTLNTSALPAAAASFRMYVFVREDPASCASRNETCPPHEASASLPFKLCHTAQSGEQCYRHVQYAKQTGIHKHPELYPGVNASSSAEEFQMMLFQKGLGDCELPCGVDAWADLSTVWCHTSKADEECYGHVQWSMTYGISEAPHAYPGLTNESSFEAFQMQLHKHSEGICPRPCAERKEGEDDQLSGDSNVELSGCQSVVLSSTLFFALVSLFSA